MNEEQVTPMSDEPDEAAAPWTYDVADVADVAVLDPAELDLDAEEPTAAEPDFEEPTLEEQVAALNVPLVTEHPDWAGANFVTLLALPDSTCVTCGGPATIAVSVPDGDQAAFVAVCEAHMLGPD
jgi:hypothetical protein